jgi:hypothetical protein
MRQRKQLKSAGTFVMDKEGNKVPYDPKIHVNVANNCAAVIKTIETGQLYRVVS